MGCWGRKGALARKAISRPSASAKATADRPFEAKGAAAEERSKAITKSDPDLGYPAKARKTPEVLDGADLVLRALVAGDTGGWDEVAEGESGSAEN